MSPQQQLQRLLAEIPGYEVPDLVSLLPLSAALQTAIYARILVLQHQVALPDTDYLLNVEQVAQRLGKSTRWVRDNLSTLPFTFLVGQEYRFSARGLDEWIGESRATKMAVALPPKGKPHAR